MDFLKKNWGLLLYSLGCLVLAVVIGRNIQRAASLASAKHKALDEQLQWFQSVKKDDFKLTTENQAAAQDNRDRAERKFTGVRLDMATKFRVDPRSPATPVEAVRKLQEEIRAINHMLDESEPPVDYKACPYLSFQSRAASKDLPAMEDVPKIFRQLQIVKEIASIVAGAHLLSLNNIDRPMDLNVIEEDLYTATPINLTVTGTADQVQSFINKITTEAKYLFFLRNITLTTADQAPNGAIGATGATGTSGAGMPGPMGPMGAGVPGMEPGMGAGPGVGAALATRPARASSTRRPATADVGMPGVPGAQGPAARMAGVPGVPGAPGPAARMPGVAGLGVPGPRTPAMAGPDGTPRDGGRTAATSEEPMWRDQLRAFVQDALVKVELRFDLIEFNQPEASQ
jgi:hypothetical protein